MSTKLLNISMASKYLNIGHQFCHKLVVEGKFKGAIKEPIPGSEVERWMIPLEDLDTYKDNRKTVGRDDGRNKFTIYLSPEELTKVTKILKEGGLPLPQRSNPPKGK